MSRHFGDSGRENSFLDRRNPLTEPGSGGWLSVGEGREDKRCAVEESKRLIIINEALVAEPL